MHLDARVLRHFQEALGQDSYALFVLGSTSRLLLLGLGTLPLDQITVNTLSIFIRTYFIRSRGSNWPEIKKFIYMMTSLLLNKDLRLNRNLDFL